MVEEKEPQDEVQEDGHPAPTAQKQGKAPAEPASRAALPAGGHY